MWVWTTRVLVLSLVPVVPSCGSPRSRSRRRRRPTARRRPLRGLQSRSWRRLGHPALRLLCVPLANGMSFFGHVGTSRCGSRPPWPSWLADQQTADAILWTVAELLDMPFLILAVRQRIRIDRREPPTSMPSWTGRRAPRGSAPLVAGPPRAAGPLRSQRLTRARRFGPRAPPQFPWPGRSRYRSTARRRRGLRPASPSTGGSPLRSPPAARRRRG